MAGFGFGFSSAARNRQRLAADAGSAPEPVSPSTTWTGTEGSGFGGANSPVPVDPTRTTAKPACRLLIPPRQYFTDEMLIGVAAAANNNGSLLDNMGLKKVVVHYEGTTFDILRPTYQTMTDANGVQRTYFGWWAVLRHDGRNGHANVYFEAVPKNAAMQRRVIGPYQFSPQAALHDASLTIAATGPIVTGVSYQTLLAALEWCRTNTRQNPLITVTEAATYDVGKSDYLYEGKGYATIRATVPITFSRPNPATDATWLFRPRYQGIRFCGANITLDFAYAGSWYDETTGVTRSTWLDGCNVTNSLGRSSLYRLAPRNSSVTSLFRVPPILTECTVTNLYNVAVGALLSRGCDYRQCWGDGFNSCAANIGNTVDDWDSSEYRVRIPSLTVTYGGGEATATLALSGVNNASTRTFTAKYGANTATFAVNATEASFIANTNYTVQNVVDWLNTLPGWSATFVDGTRRANLLQVAGSIGAWGDTNVKNTTLTLDTFYDVHADYSQTYGAENFIIADNVLTDSVWQVIFFKDGFVRDGMVFNNIFHNKAGDAQFSQMASVQSHIVVAHNSWAQQGLWLRTDFAGAPSSTTEKYQPDGYCLIACNVIPELLWVGTVDPDLVIKDNHLFTGETPPAGATGTTIGGDVTSLFANAAAGNFSPAGELLTNLKVPVVRYGPRATSPRKTVDAAGAELVP